jgi:hypothetical protein
MEFYQIGPWTLRRLGIRPLELSRFDGRRLSRRFGEALESLAKLLEDISKLFF